MFMGTYATDDNGIGALPRDGNAACVGRYPGCPAQRHKYSQCDAWVVVHEGSGYENSRPDALGIHTRSLGWGAPIGALLRGLAGTLAPPSSWPTPT